MTTLAGYIDKLVIIVTGDGRTIQGELRGFDQATNVILQNSRERVWSIDEPPEEVALGLYIIRGDNVALVGQIDPELEKTTDWTSLRADPIEELRH